MGTRTHAYMEHSITPADITGVPHLLNRNVPATTDIEAYWRRNDPDQTPRSSTWCREWNADADLTADSMRDGVAEIAAGSSRVTFYPRVALLSFSARWRGFLTIQSMRDVHRRLAHQLAGTLESPRLIWVPDFFERGFDIATNGSLNDIHSSLLADWGQPQAIESISPTVVAQCDQCPPDVWYIESTPYSLANVNAR